MRLINAMKIRPLFFVWLFFLFAASLRAVPVAVIHGAASVSPSERRFAQSLARHVERWYHKAGVDTVIADDTELGTTLSGKKVAVLVYLSQPGNAQLAALTAFVRRGGKLIVCYSASPRLAALMDLETVRYLKGSTEGRWSMMSFIPGTYTPQGVPQTILQSSSNIFLVRPVPGRAHVMAWWHDRQGRRTEEPAWLASKNGFWMTHVLLADGDAEAKGRLLLALAASVDPALWNVSAAEVLRQGRAVQKRVNAAVSVAAPAERARAGHGVASLDHCAGKAAALLSKGQGYAAWMAANELKARAAEVYGTVQRPRKGEIRAVWDHSGMGLYPGEWPRTMRLLKDAGITDLYVNVAGAGFAHYESGVLPRSKIFDEQGDQLTACLAAARACNIRVHAWILCFSTEGATQDRISIFNQRGWLLKDEAGLSRPWLDPASPEVREYLVRAVREIVSSYPVSGIHLDFVRYPDFVSSLGPSVRARFEQSVGKRVANWPDGVKKGKFRQAFFAWRVKQVSDFVQAVRRTMRKNAKGKILSAAVFGKYPSCLEAVGQDWESWINIGLVNYVTPMNYTENPTVFNEWLAAQTKTRKQALAVIPGIGVTAAESRLDSMQVIDQINAVREAGCPGFALFDLDTTLRQEILPILRLGMTRP